MESVLNKQKTILLLSALKTWSKQMGLLAQMIRLHHVVFALPFALVALLSASKGLPSWVLLAKVFFAVFFARNVAMTFNQLMDVPFDRLNPRTQNRQLAKGSISEKSAWIFLILNVLGFVLICQRINPLSFQLSLPCLVVLCFYSITKRFTSLSHFFLGLALALAPLGAWIAVKGEINFDIIPLSLAVLFWVAGFDMIYATQDEEFDRNHHLHSSIVWLGKVRGLWLARICHLAVVPFLLWFALLNDPLGLFFLSGCGIILLLLIYEHSLVKPAGDLNKVNQAFFNVNGMISLLLLVATILDLSILPLWF